MSFSKKVLIVTSSGGGGLLQAARAKQQEVLMNDPNAVVLWRDVMKDWMWKGLGRFFTAQWNNAQIKGSVWRQAFMGTIGAPIMEYFFWPHIFVCALYTIFKHDVDRVLDSQIMGTSALVKALRIYHWKRGKKIVLEKVLVDLPTPKATHYFGPIKKLSAKDREYFKLVTVPPLLRDGESEKAFWKKHCNLSLSNIQYEDFFVRQGFVKYKKERLREKATCLKIGYKGEEELTLIQKTLAKGRLAPEIHSSHLEFPIGEKERVFTVLLGSQPAKEATFNYVKNFVELMSEPEMAPIPTHLFVFCADHKPGTDSLFKKVAEYVAAVPNYPPFLTVIPMSFQTDENIGPLFSRSDVVCSRSGGQTAMEVMSVSTGEIWVHSEAKKKGRPLTNQELLAGIPAWESATAAYMQQKVGAKIVTPHTFASIARPLMTRV